MPTNSSGEAIIGLIFLGIYLIFLIALAVGFFYACYLIAKNNNMSGFYTLLGFFGVIGVIIVLVISLVTKNDNNNSNYINESKPQFKYCRECGNKIESSALFCSNCGKAFNE